MTFEFFCNYLCPGQTILKIDHFEGAGRLRYRGKCIHQTQKIIPLKLRYQSNRGGGGDGQSYIRHTGYSCHKYMQDYGPI
jgi:hypothetical protein